MRGLGAKSILAAGLLVFSATGRAELSAIVPNNEGVFALKSENTYRAFQKFVEAANESPYDPKIRMNLALTYLINKEYDKAIQENKVALEMDKLRLVDEPSQRWKIDTLKIASALAKMGMGWLIPRDWFPYGFEIHFNTAVAYGAKSEVDGALNHYQEALLTRPDSLEVKTNIELLWQAQQNKSGGGQGDQKQQSQDKESKDSQGGEKDKDQNQQAGADQDPKTEPQKNNQPQPFESQELTPDTVRKILDELKSQEQRVRAEHYSKEAKERPRDKDW